MLSHHKKWLALFGTLALAASAAFAQQTDSQLIDILIKKGVISADDVKQAQASEAKASANEPTTTISGKIFFDFTNIEAKTADGTKVNPSGFGTDVKRFYLGATHTFNKVWSMNINTDSGYSSGTGAVSTFIKTAYIQAKLDPMAIVQIGSANMPWIPFVEDNYGFRYVENTLTDRLHMANSADWGVHLLGSNGMVSYNVAAVNGGGYKNPGRSKSADFEGRVSIEPVKGLTLAVGGYSGKQGKDSNTAPVSTHTASRYSLLAVYTTKAYRLGAEYFSEDNWGYTAASATDKADGYSVFGNVTLSGPFAAFARYDEAKPSKTLFSSEKDKYFNVGVQYHAYKGVDLALVYKNERIDNPASASQVAKYDEIGLFGQIAF